MSQDAFRSVIDLIRSFAAHSRLHSGSSGRDQLLVSRMMRACTERNLAAAIERLAGDLDVALDYVGGNIQAAALRAAGSPDAARILLWLRRNPRLAAMIATLRDEGDYRDAIAAVELPAVQASETAAAPLRAQFALPITATCLSPLAHGSDAKSGNATLLRRQQVICSTGEVIDLPYYAGNALRGQLRDLLADDFLRAIGIEPNRTKPPLALWFFHCLYAGGVLEESSAQTKAVAAELGNHGAMNLSGIAAFRTLLPPVSLLGAAIGNRILAGRIYVADLRPRCKQWGSGEMDAAELVEWVYLTRREDHEGRAEEDDHHGMIVDIECFRAGTVLEGGIDLHPHISDVETACLGRGLELLAERGYLGAENSRGRGKVKIEVSNAPDSRPYLRFLADKRDEIRDYIGKIGALAEVKNARDRSAGKASRS